jgi:CYTH domain-containing protein
MEIELERTFLLKYKPERLDMCKSVEISDVYFPQSAEHPVIRLRKKGDKLELTKKFPIDGKDSSEMEEHTIILSPEEFEVFLKMPGKKLRKIRYYYPAGNLTAEIDIYQDDLQGLCVVDFEFKTKEEKDNFLMPDFCLCEVSQEETFCAGLMAGKGYDNIRPFLDRLNYKKV